MGLDDVQADGAQNVLVTATAAGFASAQAGVVVIDNGARGNTVPVAVLDDYGATGRVIRVGAPGVLANDRDKEGSPLRATLLQSPRHGTLTFAANGSFTYVPAVGYSGTDTFVYAASDGALQSAPATVTLRVGRALDVTPPLVFFVGGAQRVASRLSEVRGTATDITAIRGQGLVVASGLRGVTLRLQRPDGQFFNGRAYQSAPFELPLGLIGRAFFAPRGVLPASSPDGRYTLTATATDNAGNRATARQVVTVDSMAPVLSISTPVAGAGGVARVASLSSISGRASGTSQVSISLRRGDGLFWNGRSYQSAPFAVALPVSGGAWSQSQGLPSGSDLPPGRYLIDARASDQAGNIGGASRAVIVESAPAS